MQVYPSLIEIKFELFYVLEGGGVLIDQGFMVQVGGTRNVTATLIFQISNIICV